MKLGLRLVPLLSFVLLSVAADLAAWPGFRGANCSGLSPGAKPPTAIGPTNHVLWSVAVPWSPSSPTVVGDRIFLTTFADGKLETRAYSARDGRLLWTRAVPATQLEEFHGTEGSPAAGSPVTDGSTVVSYFGSFGLVAYDLEGKDLWQHRLPVVRTSGNFGSGTSPLIVGDRVIVNRDQIRGSTLLAVDLKTGKKVWATPRPESPSSFGTPILWTHQGGTDLVVPGSLTLRAYDPATGIERWWVRGLPSFSCTTPVVGEGMLFFAGWSPGKADSPFPSWESTVEKQDKNGDGKISREEFTDGPEWFKTQDMDADGWLTRQDWDVIGGIMRQGESGLLAIKPGGRGDVTSTHVVWRAMKGLPYVPSPLFYEGRIYLIRDGGIMSSFDAKSGSPFYVQERLPAQGGYYASPVAADGRVFVASLQGKLSEVKAGGDKPEVLHWADFGERIAGTPALVGDKMYLRTQSKLYAFGPAEARTE